MADAHPEARPRKPAPIRPDWISKTLAGLLLGLGLAISASGLLAALLHGMPLAVSGQLVMWLVPPVWLLVQSLVYFFSSGLRAWAWLGGANALALAAWWLVRAAMHSSAGGLS
ncbi:MULTISPECIES: hypothetical protein [Delftia]|uniref:Uncharacterized protein n=1 Tax=Chryseobacterium sp. B5 TaxID=2050562 RepID=A0A2G7T1P4_9FLAO|nr:MULTISPECIES: hypothetical protein [Delftia]PIF36940.1 hypothetical protein CLU98_2151 [Burkholderiales bacterium 23]MBK0111182.1 hypothetical protein [Delftia sp. S65]MBK0117049.1 hypothetical protein [Delftia sp. S67]MBK0128355.1 hypothetical protein [Delftia sp. S66]PIF67876.1 hypothetical protein CLV01_4301 [Delftia sp. 60]